MLITVFIDVKHNVEMVFWLELNNAMMEILFLLMDVIIVNFHVIHFVIYACNPYVLDVNQDINYTLIQIDVYLFVVIRSSHFKNNAMTQI